LGYWTVAQSAYAWSAQVADVPTTSFALAFHFEPSESGKFSVIETRFAPLPVTRAPPPITRLPDGQLTDTALDPDELESVTASTRWRPLTPGGPGVPPPSSGNWPGLKSALSRVPLRIRLDVIVFRRIFAFVTA
jgi:hypothetical protein